MFQATLRFWQSLILMVPGGSTTYQVPYSVNRSDYLATYWIKRKPPILGILVTDLPDAVRQKLQTNRGVLVLTVMKGSPAFFADVLKGDVLISIDNDDTPDARSFQTTLAKAARKSVTLKIVRDMREMNIKVTLKAMP